MSLIVVVTAVTGFVLPVVRVLERARALRSSRLDALAEVARWPMPTSCCVALDRNRPIWPIPKAAEPS